MTVEKTRLATYPRQETPNDGRVENAHRIERTGTVKIHVTDGTYRPPEGWELVAVYSRRMGGAVAHIKRER